MAMQFVAIGGRFASLLAQLADPRMHMAMGGGGGSNYDRLLKALGSDKSFEQQAALEEVGQVCCCAARRKNKPAAPAARPSRCVVGLTLLAPSFHRCC